MWAASAAQKDGTAGKQCTRHAAYATPLHVCNHAVQLASVAAVDKVLLYSHSASDAAVAVSAVAAPADAAAHGGPIAELLSRVPQFTMSSIATCGKPLFAGHYGQIVRPCLTATAATQPGQLTCCYYNACSAPQQPLLLLPLQQWCHCMLCRCC